MKIAIKLDWLIVFSYILSVFCAWSYGNSFSTYVTTSLCFMAFAYWGYIRYLRKNMTILNGLVLAVVCWTIYLGMIKLDVMSPLMVNTSLVLPYAISILNINYKNIGWQLLFASAICLLVVITLSGDLSEWNSNSAAFMIFSGTSIGFLWYKVEQRLILKLISVAYIVLATSYLFLTGSRNAGIVIIICLGLLIIPSRLYKFGIVYRLTYIIPILLTVFASSFMGYVFGDDAISSELTEYTSSYSQKAWGMETHYTHLLFIIKSFNRFDLIDQLFGLGIKTYHCHNLFYQCLFFYGIIGTTVVYSFFIYIFEQAYKLIKHLKDYLVLGCTITLIGHFLMQIGEVYMLGSESTMMIVLVPAGIILQRYRVAKEKNLIK